MSMKIQQAIEMMATSMKVVGALMLGVAVAPLSAFGALLAGCSISVITAVRAGAFAPRRHEGIVSVTAACCAGAMAGCQRRCLIQEKQFGITARFHDRSLSSLKLKQACHPSITLGLADDLILIIVQASTVSHQCSPYFRKTDVAFRVNSILQRHGVPFLSLFVKPTGCLYSGNSAAINNTSPKTIRPSIATWRTRCKFSSYSFMSVAPHSRKCQYQTRKAHDVSSLRNGSSRRIRIVLGAFPQPNERPQ